MKVIAFDTESTDLSASWGRILCCSYTDIATGETWTHRADRKPWKGEELTDDRLLCIAIRDELEGADIIVGWNSILHDIPLLNARLAFHGERQVKLGERYLTRHLDLMYYAGGQSLKIGGRRLDTVAKFFGTANQKTPLDGKTWQEAAAGKKSAMDLVVEHCEADVLVLRDLFPKLAPYVQKFQFPLSEVWPFIADIQSRKADDTSRKAA